jgi:hypothetical protein
MNSIYSQAVATIVALSSLNAASALPGVRANSILPSTSSETIFELRSRVEAGSPAILEYISTAHYESRAWTFQERLLSRRCLLFTHIETYFHCSEGLINMQNGELQVCEAQFNTLPDCLLSKTDRRSNWASAFPGYVGLVRDYTKRHLSYSSDALNAFAGLLELFKHRFEGKIISGLPSSILDQALLWILVDDYPTRNSNFPSWSWAGWIGPVRYWPPLDYPSADGRNNSSQHMGYTMTTTNLTRPLKSSIAHFYFSGQLLQREIDGDLSSTHSKLRTTNDLEPRDHTGEQGNSRDVFEFDALSINIAKIPVHQFCFSRQGYNHRRDFKGICGAVVSADRNLENLEPHLTDLVLLSQFSPVSLKENDNELRESDYDCQYFDENTFETREWCLLNLMIVVWHAERNYAERVGLCVMHEDMWSTLDPQLKHITLK